MRIKTAFFITIALILLFWKGHYLLQLAVLWGIWGLVSFEWGELFSYSVPKVLLFTGLGIACGFSSLTWLKEVSCLALIFWVFAWWLCYQYQKKGEIPSFYNKFTFLLGLMTTLPFFVISTAWILSNNLISLITLIALVSLTDISAFFIGKRYGKRYLASRISPKKTIEGALGSLVFISLLILLVFAETSAYFLVLIPSAAASIGGDLWESMCKRWVGVKDSGTCLPGHGGVLDRLDGFFAASPTFYVLAYMFFISFP